MQLHPGDLGCYWRFGAEATAAAVWTWRRDGRIRAVGLLDGPEQAGVRAAVHRASFDSSAFSDKRWHAMAAGLPYANARCLVAYDDQHTAVAGVTVWSAGPRGPGPAPRLTASVVGGWRLTLVIDHLSRVR
jgi:hypothetical protein